MRDKVLGPNEEMKCKRQDPPRSTPNKESQTLSKRKDGHESSALSTTHASSRSLIDARPYDSSCEEDGEFLPPNAFAPPKRAKKSASNSSKVKGLYTEDDEDDIREPRGRRKLKRTAPREPVPIVSETKKRRKKFNEKQEEIIRHAAQRNMP